MRHLTGIKLFQHLLSGTNRVVQIAIAFLAGFCYDAGCFRSDETMGFQRPDILAHRAAAHAGSFCDCLKAWPAWIGRSVFAEKEIAVHCEFSRRQAQHEHFVGDWEIVLDGTTFGVALIPYCVSLLLCDDTFLKQDYAAQKLEGFVRNRMVPFLSRIAATE